MVIGFGAGADMHKNYKQNKSQLSKKRKSVKDISETHKATNEIPVYNTMTDDEFRNFKQQLKKDKQQERLKLGIALGIIVVLALLFMVFVLY